MKLILIAFLISIAYLIPIAHASITCDKCQINYCSCSVSDCSTGTIDIFESHDCSSNPSFEYIFTNGSFIWKPETSGNLYGVAFCDDGTTRSDCNTIKISSKVATTTTTTTIPIYGPSENTFDIAIRIVAILLTLSFVFIFLYSRF